MKNLLIILITICSLSCYSQIVPFSAYFAPDTNGTPNCDTITQNHYFTILASSTIVGCVNQGLFLMDNNTMNFAVLGWYSDDGVIFYLWHGAGWDPNPETCGANPCQGLSLTFTIIDPSCCNSCDGSILASGVGGAPPYNYSWDFGATSASVSNLCAGSYFALVTDVNGCIEDSSITLICPPQPSFTHIDSLCDVYFFNSGAGTFNWDFGDGSTGTGQSPVHSYNSNGNYDVCLSSIDSLGNSCDSCITVSVINCNVGRTELENEMSNFSLYPNPLKSNLTIKYSTWQTGNIQLTLVNILGEEVAVIFNAVQNKGNHELIWENKGLSSGVYLLKLETSSEIKSKKIIIK